MMKRLILISFILSTIISCEKIITFEGEDIVPKLVINSIFESDSVFKVHVSNSKSIVGNGSITNIIDASVLIKNTNGNVIDSLTYQNNGFYIGQQYPVQNTTYKLEVNHPNYNSVNSSNEIPDSISINYIDTNTVLTNGFDELEERIELTISFDDPIGIQNFYLVESYITGPFRYMYDFDTTWSSYDTTLQVEMILTDEVFQNNGNPKQNSGIFNDLLFNGQTKLLNLEIDKQNEVYADGKEIIIKTENIKFYLHNISQDYYYYLTSLELYNDRSGNPFAQPVQVFSNIENGFGIFAGAQISKMEL